MFGGKHMFLPSYKPFTVGSLQRVFQANWLEDYKEAKDEFPLEALQTLCLENQE